ncbi:hypothetical protein RYX36_029569 [Vicia faba]
MDSIRKLPKYQVLIACGNKDITGKILEECSNLTVSGLGDTRISGGNKDNPLGSSIMDSIRKLSKHQVLIEGGNKDINGKILEECSNFGLGDTRISVTSSLAYVSDKALNFVFPD